MSGPGHGGPARGYKWPTAQPGNRIAEQHGAYSPGKVGPIAERIKQDLLTSPAYPEYLRDPSYLPTIERYSWAEAQVTVLRQHVDGQDLIAGLTEVEEREETEERSKGSTTRRGTSWHLQSAYDLLHKTETRAANLARSLGLDPVSRARILRDLSASRWYAGGMTPLDRALDRIEAERRESLEAGGDGG